MYLDLTLNQTWLSFPLDRPIRINTGIFDIVKIEANSNFSGYSIVFYSLWPIQWKEHLCVLQVLALMLSLRSSIVSYWTPWRQRGLRLPFLVNCTPFCAQNFSNWYRTKLTKKILENHFNHSDLENKQKQKDFSLILEVRVKPNKEEISAIKTIFRIIIYPRF